MLLRLSVWQRIWLHTFHKDTLGPSGLPGGFLCAVTNVNNSQILRQKAVKVLQIRLKNDIVK